tara:strand:- start:222 stop:728 length:507 start_codon:yes stop_codon:yes gene_type:complete
MSNVIWSNVIWGIDPGKGGGIAVSVYGSITEYHKYPKTIDELRQLMKMIQDKWNGKPVAYLEQVHAFPTDGRSSAFKFGTNYGVWQGFLGALDIECNLVSPQVWMKPLGLSKDKKLRKNEIKAMAQKIVDDQKDEPKINKKVTLNTSDAILINVYGWQQERIKRANNE